MATAKSLWYCHNLRRLAGQRLPDVPYTHKCICSGNKNTFNYISIMSTGLVSTVIVCTWNKKRQMKKGWEDHMQGVRRGWDSRQMALLIDINQEVRERATKRGRDRGGWGREREWVVTLLLSLCNECRIYPLQEWARKLSDKKINCAPPDPYKCCFLV